LSVEKGINLMIDSIIFTVAVYAATVAIQIYQPATGGYFNLGEAVIYIAALLRGPVVAAIAGGVGASLADLSTGYMIFAPATLVIKFIEGFVAGVLVKRFRGAVNPALGVLVGAVYTGLLIFFSYSYWSGSVSVGPSGFAGAELNPLSLDIPFIVWVVLALLIGGFATYVLARRFVGEAEALLLLLAGSLMVLGYYLYEYYVSNPLTGRPPEDAIVEVPVNIGQAVIGAALAIPLAGWLRRAGYGEAVASRDR